MNNLGELCRAQGRYAEAEPAYRTALALCRDVLGERHPTTATSYNNLAANLHAQGKHAEAEGYCRHALALRRSNTRYGHPNAVAALGVCEQITFNAEAAEAAEKKCLGISPRALRALRSNVVFFHRL